MSNWYEAVGIRDVEPDDAESLAAAVISRLQSDGIIDTEIDTESVLGGEGGYRPGPSIPSLYRREENEVKFWTIRTNGVEVCARRWVNVFGCSMLEGFTCPACSTRFPPGDDLIAHPFYDAIGRYLAGRDDLDVLCPSCNTSHRAPDWKTKPHLGFTNLAFQFWNWPPLENSWWSVDIPGLIAAIVGHNVLVTCGRV